MCRSRFSILSAEVVDKYTDYQIKLDKIYFNIFDGLYLENLTITDKNKVPLLTAQAVKINFSWLDLFLDEALTLDRVELHNSHFYLQYKTELSNIQHFSMQLEGLFKKLNSREVKTLTLQLEDASDPAPSAPAIQQYLVLKEIDIADSYFHYCNNPALNGAAGFSFDDINVLVEKSQIEDFVWSSADLRFAVVAARGEESQGNFKVEDLKTKFLFSDQRLEFSEVEARLKNHYLKSDSINFRYAKLDHLQNFDSLDLTLNIEKSQISIPHLAWIFRPFAEFKDTVNLNLIFEKRGQSLHIQNLEADFGQASRLALNDFFSDDYKKLDYCRLSSYGFRPHYHQTRFRPLSASDCQRPLAFEL